MKMLSVKAIGQAETPNRAGFTLVEVIMVVVLGVLMMSTVQMFFARSVRNTMKGQDALESIRAASTLFSSMRNDLVKSHTIDTFVASVTMALADEDIPAAAGSSGKVLFGTRAASITYELKGPAGDKYIEKKTETSTSTKFRKFGVPRMIKFEVLCVNKENIIGGVQFMQGHIVVHVVVQSDEKGFPSKEVELTTVFVPSQLSATNWNYADLN